MRFNYLKNMMKAKTNIFTFLDACVQVETDKIKIKHAQEAQQQYPHFIEPPPCQVNFKLKQLDKSSVYKILYYTAKIPNNI